MDYVSQAYWDDAYSDMSLDFDNETDPIVQLISSVIKHENSSDKTVIELGCYPGRYLKVFGDHGYCLSGIDTTPKVAKELPTYLQSKGYCVNELINEDVFNYKPDKYYDVVCSFGFIEHFTIWQSVVLKHHSMVQKDGLIIITVPNFSGFFQRTFHYLFDRKNLDRHNLKAMQVEDWIAVFDREKIRYKVLFKGAFGPIEFWVDEEERSWFKRFFLHRLLKFLNSLSKFNWKPSKHYSPYLGLVIKLL